MLNVRIDKDLEERLARLSSETGRTKTYYVQKALREFLEDQEDYQIALSRLSQIKDAVPVEEVMQRLGIDYAQL